MNRSRAKELAPIIKAFGDGEDIQSRGCGLNWAHVYHPDWGADEYRIKPKPREWWIVDVTSRSDIYPHVLSLEEKEKHFADSARYIKVREIENL